MENHPVIVRDIKTTKDPNTFQLQLEQKNTEGIVNASQALGFLMQGHEKFQESRPRSGFINVSGEFIRNNGIEVGVALPEGWNAKLVVLEFTKGEVIPSTLQPFFVNRRITVFSPRTWEDGGETREQSPKTAGKDGETLTIGGKAIYRDTYLSLFNMPKEDKLISHDNVITGSVPATQSEFQKSGVGDPKMP